MIAVDRELRIQTVCLIILATLGVAAALIFLRVVMIPFTLAVFITVGLAPVLEFLMLRVRAPRPLAVAGTMAVGLLAFLLLAGIVSLSIPELTTQASTYQLRLESLLERVTKAIPFERLKVPADKATEEIAGMTIEGTRSLIVTLGNGIVNIVSQGLLVLIFVMFLLAGWHVYPEEGSATWEEIEQRVKKYLLAKTIISAGVGVLVTIILAIVGVDFAAMFGLLTFALNFIPNIGPVVATLLPLPILLLNDDMTAAQALLGLGLPGAIHFAVGNILEPKVMGHSLDLHPIVVLLALIFWGMAWGAVGMILAVPITSVLQILANKFDATRPIAETLAGRLEISLFD